MGVSSNMHGEGCGCLLKVWNPAFPVGYPVLLPCWPDVWCLYGGLYLRVLLCISGTLLSCVACELGSLSCSRDSLTRTPKGRNCSS